MPVEGMKREIGREDISPMTYTTKWEGSGGDGGGNIEVIAAEVRMTST